MVIKKKFGPGVPLPKRLKKTWSDGHFDVRGTSAVFFGFVMGRKTREDGTKCSKCGTKSTALWRRGPKGRRTLCNMCGMRYKRGRLTPEPELQPSTPEPALPPVPLPVDPVEQMDALLVENLTAHRDSSTVTSGSSDAFRVTEGGVTKRKFACLDDENLSPNADIVASVPETYFSIERS